MNFDLITGFLVMIGGAYSANPFLFIGGLFFMVRGFLK